jgi:hypothetical protein
VVRAGTRPAAIGPGHSDRGHHLGEPSAVVDVPAGNDEPERSAQTIAGEVNLGGQSTPGSSDGVIRRFVRFPPPPLPAAAC